MPNDVEYEIAIGSDGLNLRDSPLSVGITGFTDVLNWRLDERGAPTKRLGYQNYGQLPANILEVFTFAPSGETPQILAAADDGNFYMSPGDGSWTVIATGYSATATPSFAQLNDVAYWTNGIDPLTSWDGATLSSILSQDEVQTITAQLSATRGQWTASYQGFTMQQQDDIQTFTMTGSPTGGTFTATVTNAAGSTATATGIPFGVDMTSLQVKLQALSTVSGNNLTCTGGPLNTDPIQIEFTNLMGNQPIAAITVNNGGLTGGTSPAVVVNHSQTGVGLSLASTAAQVETALEELEPIGGGNVSVTGGPLNAAPLVVEFVEALADTPVSSLSGSYQLDVGNLAITETQKGSTVPPTGTYLTTWRNRLWSAGNGAFPNRVWWSAVGDPTNWTPTNYVDILGPREDAVTGITTSPNIGTGFDGADGVLVYKRSSTHRITDDTDNDSDDPSQDTGGANVLIDASTGTVSHRSIRICNGRVYCAAVDGIYSTDGHTQLLLESSRLGRFFNESASKAQEMNMVGVAWHNSYLLALTGAGSGSNNLVLELYTGFARSSLDHQSPITAMDVPAASWTVYPGATDDVLYFADASASNTAFVRQFGVGGVDTTGSGTAQTITASARTGASTFNTPHPKRVRRIELSGHGSVQLGVCADFEAGVGETQSYDLQSATTIWGDFTWGVEDWGAAGNIVSETQWYERRGRFYSLTLLENTSVSSTTAGALGIPGAEVGGSGIFAAVCAITPLAADT